jgi:hypothetical protein
MFAAALKDQFFGSSTDEDFKAVTHVNWYVRV